MLNACMRIDIFHRLAREPGVLGWLDRLRKTSQPRRQHGSSVVPICQSPASSAKRKRSSRHSSMSRCNPNRISIDVQTSGFAPSLDATTHRSSKHKKSAMKECMPADLCVQLVKLVLKLW